MKLAILGSRGIPAHYGGFETFAERLAIGLQERGIEVTVFCEGDGSVRHDIYHGVKLSYIHGHLPGYFRTIFYDLRSLWAARKGYDIVYMLGYGAAPFCLIPRLWGATVWINPDGLEWARAKWGMLARSYFRLMEWSSVRVADCIVADSEAIAASLSSRYGTPRSYAFIPYGCDVIETPPSADSLTEWNLSPQSYYLAVCRLEPENHVLEIVRAFQDSHSDKELIVVGNRLSQTKYVMQLRSIKEPRIRMIGGVYDTSKLTSLRYHSSGYMHGHSVGGTNPSLLEAMGCGNLIFAHDNPFNRETLGSCGLYFSNARELTEAVDHAECHVSDLARLNEAAKERARTKYQWPDVVSRYVDLIAQVPAHVPGNATE
jgi:glycosyltransferase involved in cell wall biosynthesis